MKTCFKCGEAKSLAHFYKHAAMSDGHLGKCIECTKTDNRKKYYENREERAAYDRERNQTSKRKVHMKAQNQKFRARNPEKYIAHNLVNNALRDGKLFKKPCEVCSATKWIHAHHDDYSKPLKVVWLCALHHAERHKRLSSG